MIISIVNRSKSLTDPQVLDAIRVINRQIVDDFEPYWSFGATLRLEGPTRGKLDKAKVADMRGDAVVYLLDKADAEDTLGYHETKFCGTHYGLVFTALCKQLQERWMVMPCYEAMELLGDAQNTLLVQRPHPKDPRKEVFHWFEMRDALHDLKYGIA